MIIRELAPEEFVRLENLPDLKGFKLDPAVSRVLVAEDGGEIVGYQFILQVIHLEPIWIHPKYRGSSLAVRLFRSAQRLLDALRIPVSYCFSETPEIAGYLGRLGLRELPYRTFIHDPHDLYHKEQ